MKSCAGQKHPLDSLVGWHECTPFTPFRQTDEVLSQTVERTNPLMFEGETFISIGSVLSEAQGK